jgi:hypothetical protein
MLHIHAMPINLLQVLLGLYLSGMLGSGDGGRVTVVLQAWHKVSRHEHEQGSACQEYFCSPTNATSLWSRHVETIVRQTQS